MPELSTPPSLLSLYAKAAVTAPLHRGDSLPSSVYRLIDQKIDSAHLAKFQRVCGYAVSDELPPTYLHVLAFPLSVALMTERAFPFPLVGMVHVANSITVSRPVRANEVVSFTVRAADLRPHSAGRQFDLVAEATVDGEVVWSGRSTYLRREKDASKKSDAKQPGAARDRSNQQATDTAAAASVVRVPDDIGRRYAAVSGDRNPIHLHSLTAKAFGFSRAIAHGMWVKARTLAALEGRLPEAYTVDVAFKLPVLLPATIAISADEVDQSWTLDVRDAKSGKPHVTGSVTPNVISEQAAANKAPARTAPTKEAPAKKAPVKEAPAKKAPAKKAAAKTPVAKKAPTKKAPANKGPAKKASPENATPEDPISGE